MKYIFFLLALIVGSTVYSQSTYYIRADSTRLQKVGGNNELIIENSTKAITGVLVNYGNGRTRFSKPRINGDTLFVGVDTILGVGSGGGSSSYSLSADSLTWWGLEFDWALQSRVDIGEFYPVGLSYGKCFWEYWIKPYDGNGAGYLISSDYGGAHSNLFGLSDATDSTATLTGNFYPGTGTLDDYTFNSSSAMLINKVHHVAMMFDSSQVVLYIDGVPAGHKSGYFTRNTAGYGGTGKTYIGGSDHNNYNGIIYKFRGFEDYTPVTAEYFTPMIDFLPGVAGEVINMDFTRPSRQLNNQGIGFLGEKGNGAMTAQSIIGTQFTGSVNDSNRLGDSWLPQYVKGNWRIKPAYTGLSSTIPGSAKIYDGFNRQDTVPAWDVILRTDSTEGGTLGKKKWNLEAGNAFGVQNKNLWMYVGGGAYPIVSINVNDSIQDIRLEHTTGEAYFVINGRYTDANNRIEVTCHPNGTTYVSKYVAGVQTSLGTYTTPSFTTLRLVTTATTCSVYTDATLQINAVSTAGVTGGLKFGVGMATPYTRIDTVSMY